MIPDILRIWGAAPTSNVGLIWVLNIKSGILEEGYFADLVLFDPYKPLLIDRFNLLSKAKNTPFDGYQLFGEVLKTFVRGKEIYESRNINDT